MQYSYKLLLLLIISLGIQTTLAQPEACGTVIDEGNKSLLIRMNHEWHAYQKEASPRSGTSIEMVPVQLHIIRTSAGADGISVADLEAAFDRANELFLASSIQFYQCNAINYIDDDTYYTYDYSEMSALDAAHSVANVINIYSTETVTSGSTSICGHAQFPGGLDFVMLANSCTRNGSTFAHELGHYFNLYHTHETFFGAAAVDGADCSTEGDVLCDTPADPQLSSSSNLTTGGCTYTGSATDENGDSYVPDVTNLMSYTPKECRYTVTDDQNARMLFALQNYRTNLTCGSSIALNSDFEASTTSDCGSSLTVQFCDVSEGSPTGWSWNFGDGTGTSTSQHPSYSYSSAGTYDVTLTIDDGANNDATTRTALIKVGTVSVPYSEDFESGSSDLNSFSETSAMKNYIEVSSAGANSSTNGLVMEGYDGFDSPYYITPTSATAFDSGWNPYYKTQLELCVDATAYNSLLLGFDIRQLFGFDADYTNFRILINGTQIGSVYQPDGTETWSTESLDISAYDQTSFTLTLEASNKYSDTYQTTNGNATYLDNLSITGSPAILPIEWGTFEVAQRNIDVHVQWTTLREFNNDRFEVMRSLDGEEWVKIGHVPSIGSSEQQLAYQFWDRRAAALPTDRMYYQLQQVDLNGSVEMSDIREVSLETYPEWEIFPNPTDGVLQIYLPHHTIHPVHVEVFDQVGKRCFSHIIESSSTESSDQSFQIDISILPPGAYFLKVMTQSGATVSSLIRL